MSNVVPFSEAKVPAYLARAAKAEINNDLISGVTGGFPVLSIRGKVWRVIESDAEHPVLDDEDEPARYVEVVILKANRAVSKVYYAKGYTDGSAEKPACYSNDGVAPALDAAEPQANKCAVCVHNQWGSRITENQAKGKACSDTRRLAVAPAKELSRPMLLRVPAGSLRDLQAYAQSLSARGVNYNQVVTRIGFDPEVTHQKLVFRPARWVTEEELAKIEAAAASETVGSITGATMGANETASAPATDDIPGTPPAAARGSKAAPMDEAEDDAGASAPPSGAKPAKAPRQAATVAPAPQRAAPSPEPAVTDKPRRSKVVAPAPEKEDDILLAETDEAFDDLLAEFDD